MTKKKTAFRAFLMSLIALLGCVAMFAGATFAWFTSTATNSGNKIVAGTLEVDLEVLDEDTNKWDSVKDMVDPIFAYENWEPGYTQIKVMRVVNKGSLALKWKARLVTDATALSALADVIDVYVKEDVESYPTGNEIPSDWVNVGQLSSFINTIEQTTVGEIYPNATKDAYEALGIAFKMQETAGNEYQGMDLGGTFDIQILATQTAYEEGSLGSEYDAGLDPIGDDEIMTVIDGVQYVYTPDGEMTLYLVPNDYAGTEVIVPEGVTNIGGYSFYYNRNIEKIVLPSTVETLNNRAFRGTSATSITLNEGLTAINYQAFRDASKLTELVIPSTVETIGREAFQLSGIKSIVIPESVTTIEEGACRDMASLETITFDGDDVVIPNYMCRNCASLKDVYINGENVTFSGKSMAFTNLSSGEGPNVTIYVKNANVARGLFVAQGSATKYTVKIGEYVAKNAKKAADINSLTDAANLGNIHLVLAGDITGTATLNQRAGTNVILDGAGASINGTIVLNGHSSATSAETLTIQNVNFNASNGEDYFIDSSSQSGVQRYAHNVTVKDCTFIATGASKHVTGVMGLRAPFDVTVTGCEVNGAHSLVWSYGGEKVTATGNEMVDCKNGISINTTTDAVVEGNTIDSRAPYGYGIRFEGAGAFNWTVKNNTISASAPILVRKAKKAFTLTLEGNTLTKTGAYDIIIASNDYEDGVTLAAPVAGYTLVGADAYTVYQG